MGQYYYPTLLQSCKTGKIRRIKWLYSHSYGNGLKLMEHSYLGNDFVSAVCSQILRQPHVVAWIGDYSDETYGDTYEKKLPREAFMNIFNKICGQDRDKRKIHPDPLPGFNGPHSFAGWYLVNHTQKVFIDLGKYAANNKWRQSSTWNGKTEEWDMCIHPLPLLTACGNGRGGGDYHGTDMDVIGTWAFDLIEFTDKNPEGCKEIMYHFQEDR